MKDRKGGLPEPRENPYLFGHVAARARFERARRSGRMPHAWLIAGPSGIGKATLAWHMARELLAEDEPRLACPHDPGSPLFRQVAHLGHPDLHLLEPGAARGRERRSGEITVEEARLLQERLSSTALSGGYRVVLAEQADRLNRNAANALLKLLEEPPAGTVFLFVSHIPAGLPATIRSRCSLLRLQPLGPQEVMEALERLMPETDRQTRERLCRIAEGRVGRALALASEDFLRLYDRLLDRLVGIEHAAQLPEILALLKERAGTAPDPFALLQELVRRAVRVATGALPEAELVPDEFERLRKLAARQSLDRLAGLWDKLLDLSRKAEWLYLDLSQTLLLMLDEIAGRPGAAASQR